MTNKVDTTNMMDTTETTNIVNMTNETINDKLIICVVGTITSDVSILTSKSGNKWMKIKISLKSLNKTIFVKIFDEAICDQIINNFQKYDIIRVIGEPMVDTYIDQYGRAKGFIDIVPMEITYIGHNDNLIKIVGKKDKEF